MIVESSVQETLQHVRTARRNGRIIGVVPTMGALHEGHVSLIERARKECDFVVATIFVNPTQFGPGEDFSRYPRTLDADLLMCRHAGADLVFTPSAASMYQPAAQTIVRVTELSKVLEGAHRPGHFDGVSTVVAKLFHITEPDLAYFGQKDYQQQLIIRRMVEDLDFSVKIVTCPIVREPDGLAMSSRNRYLTVDERTLALRISKALILAESLAAESDLSPPQISEQMLHFLAASGKLQVGYAVVVDGQTLQNLQFRTADAVALIAVRVGTTRLIDNQILQFR